jgi:cellulose synthase/poly-beta-1,6-N-acetylglucosamine synthase-like glycosyltransferase
MEASVSQPGAAGETQAAHVRTPTFSILTPVYRTTAYVGQTVESVLSQTREDWELLLVDNACPEAGAEAVRPYLSDPRIALSRLGENRGVALARNDLLTRARGDYVIPLDSDDWLEPDYLETVAEVFGSDPGAGIVAPNAARYLDRSGRFSPQTTFELCEAPPDDDHERTLERLLRVNYVPPPVTVRREALAAVGGWAEEHEGIEDLALLCDVLLAGWRMRMVWRPICVYRVRARSTAFDETGTERLEIRVLREDFLQSLLRQGGLPPRARRQARTSLIRSRLRTAILAGDGPAVRRALWRAVRRAPSLRLVAAAIAHAVAPDATARYLR